MVPYWRIAVGPNIHGGVKFRARVYLLLVLGVIFALFPSAEGGQQVAAAGPESETLANVDNPADGNSEALNIDELFLNVRTAEQGDSAEQGNSVVTEVLSVSAFSTPVENLDIAPTTNAPTTNVPTSTTDAPTTSAPTTDAATTSAPALVAPTPVAPVTAPPTTSIAPPTTIRSTTVAPTTVAPVAPASPVSLADQAVARMSFDWQTAFPDWDLEFHGERAGIRGLTYPGEKRVEIFIRADDTAASIHRVLAHEVGHVIDVELNSNDDRRRWAEQRGLSDDAPWWPSAESPDFATGAGDFAEAFAVLEAGIQSRSTVGSQPTSADLSLMRELMRG